LIFIFEPKNVLNLLTRSAPSPQNVYHRFSPSQSLKPRLTHFAYLSVKFYGVKYAKLGVDFRH